MIDMKVIFLDFDGVLNSECCNHGVTLLPSKLELLRQLVEATDAKIVLSTSWREHWSKDPEQCDSTGGTMDLIFQVHGLQIFDKTPVLPGGREAEIKAWLDQNPVENYVVLDDRLLGADYLNGHFVKTSNYFGGLDETDVQRAIAILNSQRRDRPRKLFVVSDPHGHYSLLAEALKNAGFDKTNPDHLLVCCGDYFDRGNENLEVLQFFERLQHKVLLRGNHEDMLLKLLDTGKLLPHHYINGTMATLNNLFGKYSIDPLDDTIDFSGKTRTVDRLTEFIEETVDYYETEHYVFVHGWLPEKAETAEARSRVPASAWEKARWIKWTQGYKGSRPLADKTLICGHMPTFFAEPFDPGPEPGCADIFYGDGLIAIDAGTADSKQINVLVLEDS